MDPRFGRAGWFAIHDTDSGQTEFVENVNREGASGVGIRSAQLMVDRDVNVVITGDCGPKAGEVLKAANIKVVTGASGTVKEAIRGWLSTHPAGCEAGE